MATTNKDLAQPAYNSLNWDTPLNSNFGIIDAVLGSSTSTINLASSNYTLTTSDTQKMRIVLGGLMTGNRTVTFPSGVGGMWIISNGTTGNFTVTLTTGSGLTETAPQGYNLIVFSNGTDIYVADNGLVNKITSFVDLTISNLLTAQQIMTSGTGITVTAGSFIIGQTYTIAFIGSTDFTLIGAASNTVGLTFKATGVGTGTGTATTPINNLFLKGNFALTGNFTPAGRITPRVNSAANYTSPLAWNSDNFDEYAATALANALTISADAGTPVDGQKIMFRFLDNGTPQTLTWTTGSSKSFRAVGITLPTSTVANKVMYVGCIYNSNADRWDAVAVGTEA